MDKTNGKNVYYVNDPKNGKPGDFEYNGRGATYDCNNANYTIIGNAVPKVYGGINTSVSYKGIALSLGFTYKIGGDLYDCLLYTSSLVLSSSIIPTFHHRLHRLAQISIR